MRMTSSPRMCPLPLKSYAEANGYEIALFEGYDSGTTDFAPFINKIQEAAPDAILGGGHFQDGSTFARQLAEKKVTTPYVALLVAPPEPKFAELGDAALGIIGPSQWEPQAAYSKEAADAAGVRWYGPSVQEFTDAYTAAYGEEPSYHAAGGYAAGLILQEAIERAGSTDSAKVQAALDATDLLTFFGRIKFDATPRPTRPAGRPRDGLCPVAEGRRGQPGQRGHLASGRRRRREAPS